MTMEMYLLEQSADVFKLYEDKLKDEVLCGGHIGLAEIKDGNAELDNMMRGESGGPIDLMLEAERTLINWAIECLALKSITLRIQSRNFLAMKNHFELGFVRSNRLPLMRVEKGDSFVLEPCEPEFATESFYMDVLTYSAIPKGS
jgi:hypothetical protein